MSFFESLLQNAAARPDHPAIEDGERLISCRMLLPAIDRMVNSLLQENVRHGDKVAVVLPNSADHLILICALLKIGAVICPASTALPLLCLQQYLARMTVTAVVSGSDTPLVENIRHLRLSQLLQYPPLPTVPPAQVNPADPAVCRTLPCKPPCP